MDESTKQRVDQMWSRLGLGTGERSEQFQPADGFEQATRRAAE